MTVFTDFYAATADEAQRAFAWVSVPAVGEPPAIEDDESFQAYEAWRERQPRPEPSSEQQSALSALASFESKFILADRLALLCKALLGEAAEERPTQLLASPSYHVQLHRLPDPLLATLVEIEVSEACSKVVGMPSFAEHLWPADEVRWFLEKLCALARGAASSGRGVYVLTSGDG